MTFLLAIVLAFVSAACWWLEVNGEEPADPLAVWTCIAVFAVAAAFVAVRILLALFAVLALFGV